MKSDPASLELVTLKDLATQWKMDRKTVRRLLAESGVTCYTFTSKSNGSIRYDKREVEKFLNQCTLRAKIAG